MADKNADQLTSFDVITITKMISSRASAKQNKTWQNTYSAYVCPYS